MAHIPMNYSDEQRQSSHIQPMQQKPQGGSKHQSHNPPDHQPSVSHPIPNSINRSRQNAFRICNFTDPTTVGVDPAIHPPRIPINPLLNFGNGIGDHGVGTLEVDDGIRRDDEVAEGEGDCLLWHNAAAAGLSASHSRIFGR